MLVEKEDWEKIVSKMGIENKDEIIIYDNSDVISSCRCWFNFIYFGHNPKLVHILNGGFTKWVKEKRKITTDIPQIKFTNYKSYEKKDLVKRVEKVKNQEDITNYYLENGELIFQYYDQKQNPNFMKKKRTSHNKKTMKKHVIP